MLTRNVSQRPVKLGSGNGCLNVAVAKDGVKYYNYGLVVLDSAGRAIKALSAAGNRPGGVLMPPTGQHTHPELREGCHLDMTSVGFDGSFGTNGTADYEVVYDQKGEWAFAVGGGTPVAGADVYAQAAEDDNTVTATAPANATKIGVFTRPAPGHTGAAEVWFVDLGRS